MAQTGDLQQYFKDGGVTHLLVKGGDGKPRETPIEDCAFLKEHCALYFSAHWCGPCRNYTPKLAEAYKKGEIKLTVIFNSWDRSQADFDGYYAEHPWAAIPFRFKEKLQDSTAFTQPRGIPSLMLFNPEGNLYQPNGRSMIFSRPFPHDDPKLEDLFDKVIDGNGDKVPTETLKSKKYFGLYFSASWCPPCRMFTPVLSKFVTDFKAKRDDVEFIFCSSDRDDASFKAYFKKMSFLAVDKFNTEGAKGMIEFLSQKCDVQGIPHLAILDIDGNVLCKNARSRVDEDKEGAEFPWILPSVQDIGKTIEGINEKPSFIMFCESKSEEEQATLLSYLEPHAKVQDGMKGKREVMHFISKGSSDIGGRVKAITGVTDNKLILLAIQKGQVFIKDLPATAEDVPKMWAEYQEGLLEGKKLSM